MQMTLKQAHIEAAIRDFVAKAGITFPVEEMNFTAGRGKDGLTATIDMADPFSALLDGAVSEKEAPEPKAVPLSKREAAPKAEPAPAEKAKEDETPDQAFVADEEDAPAAETSPFASDAPVTEAKEAAPKAGVSLFG